MNFMASFDTLNSPEIDRMITENNHHNQLITSYKTQQQNDIFFACFDPLNTSLKNNEMIILFRKIKFYHSFNGNYEKK